MLWGWFLLIDGLLEDLNRVKFSLLSFIELLKHLNLVSFELLDVLQWSFMILLAFIGLLNLVLPSYVLVFSIVLMNFKVHFGFTIRNDTPLNLLKTDFSYLNFFSNSVIDLTFLANFTSIFNNFSLFVHVY